jgi:hypothetical protein
MKRITLAEWVECYGKADLARDIGVTWAAVDRWTSGIHYPKPEHAHRIIELSNGILTLEDIYPKDR